MTTQHTTNKANTTSTKWFYRTGRQPNGTETSGERSNKERLGEATLTKQASKQWYWIIIEKKQKWQHYQEWSGRGLRCTAARGWPFVDSKPVDSVRGVCFDNKWQNFFAPSNWELLTATRTALSLLLLHKDEETKQKTRFLEHSRQRIINKPAKKKWCWIDDGVLAAPLCQQIAGEFSSFCEFRVLREEGDSLVNTVTPHPIPLRRRTPTFIGPIVAKSPRRIAWWSTTDANKRRRNVWEIRTRSFWREIVTRSKSEELKG